MMETLRDIIMKHGTGYTRNRNNNKIDNTQDKNINNGKIPLPQQKKNVNQMTDGELRDYLHQIEEGKQIVDGIKQIMKGK